MGQAIMAIDRVWFICFVEGAPGDREGVFACDALDSEGLWDRPLGCDPSLDGGGNAVSPPRGFVEFVRRGNDDIASPV
jgi:hypothetical protein